MRSPHLSSKMQQWWQRVFFLCWRSMTLFECLLKLVLSTSSKPNDLLQARFFYPYAHLVLFYALLIRSLVLRTVFIKHDEISLNLKLAPRSSMKIEKLLFEFISDMRPVSIVGIHNPDIDTWLGPVFQNEFNGTWIKNVTKGAKATLPDRNDRELKVQRAESLTKRESCLRYWRTQCYAFPFSSGWMLKVLYKLFLHWWLLFATTNNAEWQLVTLDKSRQHYHTMVLLKF